jgi:hypothetical protein
MSHKKLPDRSWMKEEHYIDLGNIGDENNRDNNNNKEQQKQWGYRLIKQEGSVKTLKISSNGLTDFLSIANSINSIFEIYLFSCYSITYSFGFSYWVFLDRNFFLT